MRTGAEVLGVIQTNHLARTAGAGDARQVAGGPTLAALLLLIWEHLVINLLRLHHTLGIQIQSHLSFRVVMNRTELSGRAAIDNYFNFTFSKYLSCITELGRQGINKENSADKNYPPFCLSSLLVALLLGP